MTKVPMRRSVALVGIGWRKVFWTNQHRIPSAFTSLSATSSPSSSFHPSTASTSVFTADSRRCKSSSSSSSSSSASSLLDFMPDSVRDNIKSSLLKEATKPSFWKDEQQQDYRKVNGSHGAVNGSGVNGVNGHATASHSFPQTQHQQQQAHPLPQESHFTPQGHIDHAQSDFHDPLDEWFLDRSTRYWPDLPQGVDPNLDPFALVKPEMDALAQSILDDLIRTDHPVLHQAAGYFFESEGGKKIRPMMVCLISRALGDAYVARYGEVYPTSQEEALWTEPLPGQRSDLPAAQRRLAEISELIHTASLFHDDVIDGAALRRNRPTVHKVFGNKMAILAGDYLLARASISLARLRDTAVVECMSTIIEHLVRGEVMQLHNNTEDDEDAVSFDDHRSAQTRQLEYYLAKNYYKTASLMANSCRSAALLGQYPSDFVDAAYEYGKHMGIAFQLVDDVLDFGSSTAAQQMMGKPALGDLKAGLATAPVLLALQQQQQQDDGSLSFHDELYQMMKRKFSKEGDVERAAEIVMVESNGIEATNQLAKVHAELAVDAILKIMPASAKEDDPSSSFSSPYRDALIHLAYKVVDRIK